MGVGFYSTSFYGIKTEPQTQIRICILRHRQFFRKFLPLVAARGKKEKREGNTFWIEMPDGKDSVVLFGTK
jgi:hypothetical protein